jgi:hypothetical protein
VLYLHGFASSAKSTKAAHFSERLRARGVVLQCPDFNLPDFRSLTMTRMLDQLTKAVDDLAPAPVSLIGSSLGGALAVLAASRLPGRVDRLVLLAPFVMLARPGHHLLPPDRIDQWRRDGAMPFFHHGDNQEHLLDFAFYADTLEHDAFEASFEQPTLIVQGVHDSSVDYRAAEAFAASRANVRLLLVNDDHRLVQSLPRIWDETERFLGLR